MSTNECCLFVCLQIQWYRCYGWLKFYREPIITHVFLTSVPIYLHLIYIKMFESNISMAVANELMKIIIQIQMCAHYWKSGSIYQNHPHEFVKCCIFNNNMPVIACARALWKHNFAHFLHLTFEYAPISKSHRKTVCTMRALLFVFESLMLIWLICTIAANTANHV